MITPTSLPLVIDIGMYDAADTEYYLATGHRVLAVEANPRLVRSAVARLSAPIREGRLSISCNAIAPTCSPVTLVVSGNDLGSSSVVPDWIPPEDRGEALSVDGITMDDVLELAGEPAKLIKIDIEGADSLCINSITEENRPQYLSVEAHERCEEYIDHLASTGFTKFKLIEQTTFRAVENMGGLMDRIASKIVRVVGYAEPRYIRRNGRRFAIGHSSGPAPWCSDGKWHTARETIALWSVAQARMTHKNYWFDIHAS
jgi:FkbM family methyltransferase